MGPSMFEAMTIAAESATGQALAVGQFGVGMAFLEGSDGAIKSKEVALIHLRKAAV